MQKTLLLLLPFALVVLLLYVIWGAEEFGGEGGSQFGLQNDTESPQVGSLPATVQDMFKSIDPLGPLAESDEKNLRQQLENSLLEDMEELDRIERAGTKGREVESLRLAVTTGVAQLEQFGAGQYWSFSEARINDVLEVVMRLMRERPPFNAPLILYDSPSVGSLVIAIPLGLDEYETLGDQLAQASDLSL